MPCSSPPSSPNRKKAEADLKVLMFLCHVHCCVVRLCPRLWVQDELSVLHVVVFAVAIVVILIVSLKQQKENVCVCVSEYARVSAFAIVDGGTFNARHGPLPFQPSTRGRCT